MSDAPTLAQIRKRRMDDVFEGRSAPVSASRLMEHIQERPDADAVLYEVRRKCDDALESMLGLIDTVKDVCDDDKEVMWQFIGIYVPLEYVNAISKACADYPGSLGDDWIASNVTRHKTKDAEDGREDSQ